MVRTFEKFAAVYLTRSDLEGNNMTLCRTAEKLVTCFLRNATLYNHEIRASTKDHKLTWASLSNLIGIPIVEVSLPIANLSPAMSPEGELGYQS